MKLPRHDGGGLTLEHNPQLGVYESVSQYAEHHFMLYEWPPGERDKAIATNELWVMQWYPDTPIGSYVCAASTLEALLAYANRDEP